MVAQRLLAANNSRAGRRTLRATTPYHTRLVDRRKELVLSEKPEALRHVRSLDKHVQEQYRTLVKRERTPLDEAAYYARQMEARHAKSIAALAGLLKLCPKRIERHLHLLELPEPIRKFLNEHRTPEILRHFTERKLGSLRHLGDRTAWRKFQSMVREVQDQAGIWQTPK